MSRHYTAFRVTEMPTTFKVEFVHSKKKTKKSKSIIMRFPKKGMNETGPDKVYKKSHIRSIAKLVALAIDQIIK